jgi:hypothetical protein
MELNEYLLKSKAKRKEIVKLAENYFTKSVPVDYTSSLNLETSAESFPGPTPRRLQIFESNVTHQLQKIFGANDNQLKIRFLSKTSAKESLRDTYSLKSRISKKKQLVILPKNYYFTPMKTPIQSLNLKLSSLSPDTVKIKEQNTTRLVPLTHLKKESLLLPVLSTMGTHEERSKIYKYR